MKMLRKIHETKKCNETPNKIPCVDSPGAINISSDDSYYNYTLMLIIKRLCDVSKAYIHSNTCVLYCILIPNLIVTNIYQRNIDKGSIPREV